MEGVCLKGWGVGGEWSPPAGCQREGKDVGLLLLLLLLQVEKEKDRGKWNGSLVPGLPSIKTDRLGVSLHYNR